MAHKIQSVIVLDIESGGLNPTKNPITSVALSSFSLYDGAPISKYKSFVQPYSDLVYEDAAMKFTGITFTQLHAGKSIKEVVSDLCVEFQKANLARTHTKKPILAGHNIGFDIGFIMKAFSFCRENISKYLHCNIDGNGNHIPASFDTMWLSRMKWGGDESMTKYNLEACCNKADISLTDAHDAANDVASTESLLLTFMKHLRGSSVENQSVSNELKERRKRDHFQI